MADSISPIDAVQRTQEAFEKGPITAIAAFFTVAFFFALYFLIRTKSDIQKLQFEHAKQLAEGEARHAEEMASLYQDEKARAVKHEVTMSRFLDMMEDVRFIAFEMRRVRLLRERRKDNPTE